MSNSINAAVGAAVSLTATVGLYMYEQYKRKKQGILMNKNVEVESSTLRS